jgi:hypothetical protein
MPAAQQLGMTLRDASTSEQAKSDHKDLSYEPPSKVSARFTPGQNAAVFDIELVFY